MLNFSRIQLLNLSTILIITTVALLSCNNQTHTVEYYLEHVDEMRAKVKECENNSNAKNDQNCQNAMKATFKASMKSENMPKIK